jgi:hypothetical protein
MSNFNYLNPDNFKKWMKSQDDFKIKIEQSLIGLNVETKFSAKRLSKKVTIENGKLSKVLREFVDNGGILKEINEDDYLIEVDSGSFYINKKYVII